MKECAVAVAVLMMFAGSATAQSLADVARREDARRKEVKSAGKTYTNEALKPVPAPADPPTSSPTGQAAAASSADASAPAAGTTTPGAEGTPKDATDPEEPGRNEESWRKRMQSERDALARAEIFAEALQSRINGLSADFTARDDPAQRSIVAADRQKALAELDRVRQEIRDRTKVIADIQEEARRAGVPAGWVR